MSDVISENPWRAAEKKPKQQSISEIMQNSRADSSCERDRIDLRGLLVQRTMERHGFTEGQALAVIPAFAG